MEIRYYPNAAKFKEAIETDDPLLMLVSYDGQEILLANIDDAFEHYILMKKLGYRETEIDRFYRVVLNQEGADWIFVCPDNYKCVEDKNRRIEAFYKDGINQITKAIQTIGYNSEIQIPQRYLRQGIQGIIEDLGFLKLAEDAFQEDWDNEEDDFYDSL